MENECYDDLCEVHGEEFAEGLAKEFPYVSRRERVINILKSILGKKYVWYIAGFVDAAMVLGVLYHLEIL